MTRLYKYILAAGVILALSLTGCVSEDSPCPPGGSGDDGKAVTLRFTVVTRSAEGDRPAEASEGPALAPSRADDCYADQTGTPAENFINTADCQFLLFDADRRLLRPIFPEVTEKDDTQYTWYSITTSITEKYFDERIKAGQDVTFYIMVIANTRGLNGQYVSYVPGVTTIEDVANQRRTFVQPGLGQLGNGMWYQSGSWQPSIDGKRYIPMSGLQQFTVSAPALKASTYDAPVELSESGVGKDIDMLRAVSKIEVVDKLEIPEGSVFDETAYEGKRMRIEKLSLFGFFSKGAIIPMIERGCWPEAVTEQVSSPTMPDNLTYFLPIINDQGHKNNVLLQFDYDESATNQRTDKCRVYSVYVVEYSRVLAQESIEQSPLSTTFDLYPHIEVTVVNPGEADTNGSPVFTMKLAKFIDGAAGEGLEELLRNHIYRYEVTGISSDLLEGKWTVCEWGEYSVIIPPIN